MLGSRLGYSVLVRRAQGPTRALKRTILIHLVYKGKILNSTQNNEPNITSGSGPNVASGSGPKQLSTHIKKITKVKITELARHIYYSEI